MLHLEDKGLHSTSGNDEKRYNAHSRGNNTMYVLVAAGIGTCKQLPPPTYEHDIAVCSWLNMTNLVSPLFDKKLRLSTQQATNEGKQNFQNS